MHPEPAELFQFQEIESEEEYAVKELDAPVYHPTSKEHIRLEGMALAQKQRIYLNVGGTKFETSVPTLQSDPSSLLARMVLPNSPLKPYSVENVYVYFLDRDPKLFSFKPWHGSPLKLSAFRRALTEPSTAESPVLLFIRILPAVREEHCETFKGTIKFRIVRNVQTE